MKKLLKIFAVLVVVLVVLVVGAAIAVPMLIDGDDVKAAVAEQVKRHTGRDLRIPGEVEILPGGAAKASVSADAAFDPAADRLRIKNLVASVLDLKASGAVEISALSKDPRLAGELTVAEFSPRDMMKALGAGTVETTDARVLGKMALKTGVSGSASHVKPKPLSLTLDDTTASGEAGVSNFAAPAVRFALELDASGEPPRITLNEKLSTVQLEPLLEDLQGEAPISGTANLSAKLSASGAGADSVMKTLNGNLSFQFLDGALNGVNIAQMIRDAKATITGGAKSGDSGPKKTDFAEISGTAKVTNGTISNQDLKAKSPLLRLSGKGTAALPTQALNYRATATLVATSKGQGGKDLADLAGIPVPVIITGTFTEPSYALDMQVLAQSMAKGKAKELVDTQGDKVKKKVEASVKEKLGASLGEQAGKLLGGDKQGGGLLNNLLNN